MDLVYTHLKLLSHCGSLLAELLLKPSQKADGGLPARFSPHLQSTSTSLSPKSQLTISYLHETLSGCTASLQNITAEHILKPAMHANVSKTQVEDRRKLAQRDT